MFFVPFNAPPPGEFARLLRTLSLPSYPDEPLEDQCRRALAEVGRAGRTLLIYDAVASEHVLDDWMPAGGLDWHLIVTSTSASWERVPSLCVTSLLPDAQLELAVSILGDVADREVVARVAAYVVAKAGGVTIQLCPSARAARERLRHRRGVEDSGVALATAAATSFESAWTLLSEEARIVLKVASTFATPRVPMSLIASALERTGWTVRAVEDALDEARDRQLTAGDLDTLDTHQLVARFVRSRGSLAEPLRRALLRGLRKPRANSPIAQAI